MKSEALSPPVFSSLFVGHFAGSLGFAVGLTSPRLMNFFSVEAITVTAGFWNMTPDFWHLPFLATINMLLFLPLVMTVAVYTTFAMLPLTIMTCPIAIFAAMRLTTRRLRTTLYGALVGLVVGLPLASAMYGSRSIFELSDPGWMAGACAAGALFAQPIWTWCIRPRITPAVVGAPTPRARPRLVASVTAWLALTAAYVLALILFG